MFNEAREQYRACRRNLLDELGVEPDAETTQLFGSLKSGPRVPYNNFSSKDWQVAGQLLGQSALVNEVRSRLSDASCRLVSLVGLRGSGKTSLAIAVATSLAVPRQMVEDHPFPDGIILVRLSSDADIPGAGQPDNAAVVDAIGLALGMAFYGNVDRLEQLTAYLDQKRMLLILDGMEDVPGGISVVRALLRRADQVSILCTAADLLGLPDEWVFYVDGAELPESCDILPGSAATHILTSEIQRRQSVLRAFEAVDLTRICHLTGGLPLALKIVAGWLRAVPPGEVIRQLEHGGELLADPVDTGSGEGLALSDLLTDEWSRLSARHQQVISRLAVFAGQFDFKAAAAVGVSLLNLLTLCRMRVIRCHADDTYTLHPLLRLYCRLHPRLDTGETEEPGRLHAAYFASWIEQRSSTLREQPVAPAIVSRYLPDLIAAWDWAIDRHDTTLLRQMLSGLAAWHSLAGRHHLWTESLTHSAARMREALKHNDNAETRSVLARILLAQADIYHRIGQLDLAARALQEVRLQGEIVDDPEFNARTNIRYSQVLHARGKHHDVVDLLEQARLSARQAQHVAGEAYTQVLMSLALSDYGDYARSLTAIREAEALALRSGQPVSLANVHLQFGHLAAERGDFARARSHLDQSLHIGREFLNSYVEGWSHAYLGRMYDDGSGQHQAAARHLDMASAIFVESGDLSFGSYLEWALGRNAFALGDLDRATQHFERGLELGRVLDSPASKSRALTGLGQVALARNDGPGAESATKLALQLVEDAGRRPLATRARIVLGQSQERIGRAFEARATFQRARSDSLEMGLPFIYCEAAAGLANVSLMDGDVSGAGAFAADAFDYLVDHSLAGCDNPAWVVLACYGAFSANGDIRAQEAVRKGAEIMLERAETLDAASRKRYFESHPHRRTLQQIMQANRPARPLDLARITPV
jgi:tetratricopeptide (TPR) repeat protein